jgi:hypothetical protein
MQTFYYCKMKFEQLIKTISETHHHLQEKAVSAVNQSLTIRNWIFGFYIVEYEQNGEDRAKYGQKLLAAISKELKKKNIKGLAERNLAHCRLFYKVYPQIIEALPQQSLSKQILQSVTAKSISRKTSKSIGVNGGLLITKLSFTHIVELLNEELPLKRTFYEIQSIKGNWSVRELQRQ